MSNEYVFFLLSTVSGISQPQNKKDSIEIARKAQFEIAKEVLKAKTFGILPDDNRTPYDRKNFMGFENNKLILQGVYARSDARHVCEVKNYIYKLDDNGNVTVTFDFTGRVTSGKFKIVMQKGDNYVEIIETLGFIVNNPISNPFKLYGEVFPSDSCNYMVIANEL